MGFRESSIKGRRPSSAREGRASHSTGVRLTTFLSGLRVGPQCGRLLWKKWSEMEDRTLNSVPILGTLAVLLLASSCVRGKDCAVTCAFLGPVSGSGVDRARAQVLIDVGFPNQAIGGFVYFCSSPVGLGLGGQ